jgi:GxxExxY protein
MRDTIKHKELTSKILKAFYHVYNALGYGFLEKVYENALLLELGKAGLRVTRQQPIKVYYEGSLIGDYFADLVVENRVIIELKVAEAICDAHVAQLRNYLRATEIEGGLLLNFGTDPQFARKYFSNESKRLQSDPF